MRFDDFRIASIIKGNLDDLGFKRPTDIQYKAIPSIMNGEDVLAIAQTGTGKTAAFAIPIVNKIHTQKRITNRLGIKCLVMVPTRELAHQVSGVFNQVAKGTRVSSFAIFGGVEQDPQIKKLQKGIDVLVSTPGRMFDLVNQGFIQLDRVETLILDEADRMLDLGFYKDIVDALKFIPKQRQTLFFSATIDKHIKKLAYSLVKDAIRIQISPKDPVSKNVEHTYARIEMDDKRFFLERMIRENLDSKMLVFVRTKVRAERVVKALERVDIVSKAIHGDKEQKERFAVLDEFRKGEFKLLVATDVSARGIDIPNVEFVINYDLPDVDENYVHRVGRCGRGNNKGFAVSYCSEGELELLKSIENYLSYDITQIGIDKGTYQETLDFSDDGDKNWQALLLEDEKFEKEKLVRKKKKK